MIEKDKFFREFTIRLCSSLDIKTALKSVFEYLKGFFPVDELHLGILDAELGALRLIGYATAGDIKPPEGIIPVTKELWKELNEWKHREPYVVNSIEDLKETLLLFAKLTNLGENSEMILPLWIQDNLFGGLTIRAKGQGRFTPDHAELLGIIAEPTAIVLTNALAHEKLMKQRDALLDDNTFLKTELRALMSDEIIGDGLKNVLEMVSQVAPLNSPVLLLGETGTGKEIIANAIHFASPRKDGPFIKVNCGAIPESLVDSELFGHEKGAFTGAVTEQKGRFERADGGTIFLDEIGELPQHAQVRLLRVLQTKEIERVGGGRQIRLDIRVIAATHRNLESMISENKFREDLWFRLNVFPIIIPPLRHRKEDIPALVRHFINKKSIEMGIPTPAIAPGALERLMHYEWPGNVRELENVIEREVIRYRGGRLMFDMLPLPDTETVKGLEGKDAAYTPLNIDQVVSMHISKVLQMTNGKIHGPGGAAEILGIKASTLRARMDKLGIRYGRHRPGLG